MNQHQRKFLLEEIEKQFKREREQLKEHEPEAPSLNNYLIAAILDGSAVMKTREEFRKAIFERVRDLGKGYSLLETEDGWGRHDDETDMIKIPALLLYDEPPDYTVVREKYESELKKWNDDMAALEASINAMRIKVQVGSDDALANLIDQADKLCSMSLTQSSQLMLPHKAPKQLTK